MGLWMEKKKEEDDDSGYVIKNFISVIYKNTKLFYIMFLINI